MRSLAAVIWNKELREIFRDKRTRTQVIISPLIITPLLFRLHWNDGERAGSASQGTDLQNRNRAFGEHSRL